MDATPSPQHSAVGEAAQIMLEDQTYQGLKQSYASHLTYPKSAEKFLNLELCPVSFDNGIPVVEFTVEDVNSFTKEEDLHQAVVIKYSYGKRGLQELKKILPKQLGVKGNCNIGQLEYRHILVRFDLFEDYAHVVSRTNGYINTKGDDFFFRTFPWTMGFNPREETSKAVVWISFPDLPANLFAKKSLMSIASAMGKPMAIDKATRDRTRPSTARVKVLINLLDKHPKKIQIKIKDPKIGQLTTFDHKIVLDNAPAYCTICNHLEHNVGSCRWNDEELSQEVVDAAKTKSKGSLAKLKGDARDYLNANLAARQLNCKLPNVMQYAEQTIAPVSMIHKPTPIPTEVGMQLPNTAQSQNHLKAVSEEENSEHNMSTLKQNAADTIQSSANVKGPVLRVILHCMQGIPNEQQYLPQKVHTHNSSLPSQGSDAILAASVSLTTSMSADPLEHSANIEKDEAETNQCIEATKTGIDACPDVSPAAQPDRNFKEPVKMDKGPSKTSTDVTKDTMSAQSYVPTRKEMQFIEDLSSPTVQLDAISGKQSKCFEHQKGAQTIHSSGTPSEAFKEPAMCIESEFQNSSPSQSHVGKRESVSPLVHISPSPSELETVQVKYYKVTSRQKDMVLKTSDISSIEAAAADSPYSKDDQGCDDDSEEKDTDVQLKQKSQIKSMTIKCPANLKPTAKSVNNFNCKAPVSSPGTSTYSRDTSDANRTASLLPTVANNKTVQQNTNLKEKNSQIIRKPPMRNAKQKQVAHRLRNIM